MLGRTLRSYRWAAGFTLGFGLLAAAGCGKADSHGAYERELKMREDASASLESLANKMEKKKYAGYGDAWVVDLNGKQVTAATFDSLARAGAISELYLSKTNLTDADMRRVAGVTNVCTNLDLSHNPGITDTGLGELTTMLFAREINLAGTKCTQAGSTPSKSGSPITPCSSRSPPLG